MSTVKELRIKAKEMGITGVSKMNKEQLIAATSSAPVEEATIKLPTLDEVRALYKNKELFLTNGTTVAWKVVGANKIGEAVILDTITSFGSKGKLNMDKVLTGVVSIISLQEFKDIDAKLRAKKIANRTSNRKNTSKYNVVIENNKVFVNENWTGGRKVQAGVEGSTREIIQAGLVVKKKTAKELMEMFSKKMK